MQLIPAGAQGGFRKITKHAQAPLLCINQVQQALLVGFLAVARCVQQGAHGPFLACLFRGLHGVQQGHQQARHTRHACGVGHVEHQLHQTGDQVAVGRHGIERAHGLPVNLQAQGRQRFQPEQCPGHERQRLG